MYQRVADGFALIRHGLGGAVVRFRGAWVFPIIHRAERIDLGERVVTISQTEGEGLRCRDGIRADLVMDFHVVIIPTPEAVMKVHQLVGSKRAGDPEFLHELFEAKFLEALKGCARAREFSEIEANPDAFREAVVEMIGDDLNGFIIDDCEIVSLSETPLEFLDPTDILDAEGIKKITEREAAATAKRNTEEWERKKREAIERAKRQQK